LTLRAIITAERVRATCNGNIALAGSCRGGARAVNSVWRRRVHRASVRVVGGDVWRHNRYAINVAGARVGVVGAGERRNNDWRDGGLTGGA
jgi:hypothetical protein